MSRCCAISTTRTTGDERQRAWRSRRACRSRCVLACGFREEVADEWGQDFGEKVAKVRVAAKAFGEDKDCAFEAKVRFLSLSLHSSDTADE